MGSFLYLKLRHWGKTPGRGIDYEDEVYNTFSALRAGLSNQRISFFSRVKQPSAIFHPFTHHHCRYCFHRCYFFVL
jgi:hypothetical protein